MNKLWAAALAVMVTGCGGSGTAPDAPPMVDAARGDGPGGDGPGGQDAPTSLPETKIYAGVVTALVSSPDGSSALFRGGSSAWNTLGTSLERVATATGATTNIGTVHSLAMRWGDLFSGDEMFFVEQGPGPKAPNALRLAETSTIEDLRPINPGQEACAQRFPGGMIVFTDAAASSSYVTPGSSTLRSFALTDPLVCGTVAASPDGLHLTYLGLDLGGNDTSLHVLDLSGASPVDTAVWTTSATLRTPQITSDGGNVVFIADGAGHVKVLDLATSGVITFSSQASAITLIDDQRVAITKLTDGKLVIGNLSTGAELPLGHAGTLIMTSSGDHAIVFSQSEIGMAWLTTGTWTPIDTEIWTSDGPPEVVGTRVVYLTGTNGSHLKIRTADPLAHDSASTLVDDFAPTHVLEFATSYVITADHQALLYLASSDLWQQAVTPGGTPTKLAEAVYQMRYVPATDRLLLVRGRSSGPALADDGLYIRSR